MARQQCYLGRPWERGNGGGQGSEVGCSSNKEEAHLQYNTQALFVYVCECVMPMSLFKMMMMMITIVQTRHTTRYVQCNDWLIMRRAMSD